MTLKKPLSISIKKKNKTKKVKRELLGQGTYGCVYKPAFKCSSSNTPDNKLISKVIEKYEAIDSGHCSITGLNEKNVIRMIDFVIKNFSEIQKNPLPEAYNQINISNKFLNIILGMRDIADHSTWGDK